LERARTPFGKPQLEPRFACSRTKATAADALGAVQGAQALGDPPSIENRKLVTTSEITASPSSAPVC